MKSIKLIGALSIALTSVLANAQTCNLEQIHSSRSVSDFLINEDGTVTDVVNGIQWQLCSVGQTYDADAESCMGTPTNFATWQSALSEPIAAYAGHDDWRIPNIKELGSIVERACMSPAIDLSIFVSTPSVPYWSSTYDHQVNDIPGRIIDFADGTEFLKTSQSQKFVRLVRSVAK